MDHLCKKQPKNSLYQEESMWRTMTYAAPCTLWIYKISERTKLFQSKDGSKIALPSLEVPMYL